MATPALSAIRKRGLRRMEYRGIINAREVMMTLARTDVEMPLHAARKEINTLLRCHES